MIGKILLLDSLFEWKNGDHSVEISQIGLEALNLLCSVVSTDNVDFALFELKKKGCDMDPRFGPRRLITTGLAWGKKGIGSPWGSSTSANILGNSDFRNILS